MNLKKIFLFSIIFLGVNTYSQTNKNYTNFNSQYFISESAFNLKQGEVQYSNMMLFYNELSAGVTDYMSIGVSTLVLGFFTESDIPTTLKIKFSQRLANKLFQIGGGLNINTELNYKTIKPNGYIYEPYGMIALGNEINNIGLTFSIPYEDGFWDEPNYKLTGKLKITKRTALMGEFLFHINKSYQEYVSLLGARTYFNKAALDYGIFIPESTQGSHLPIWPFVGIKIHLF
jgi:hypothetical protein